LSSDEAEKIIAIATLLRGYTNSFDRPRGTGRPDREDLQGNRGGEFFTPLSIVRLLVEMLEPRKGIVFDPASGSGGMFIQSERFTHKPHLSFYGRSRSKPPTPGRMNLCMHGLDGEISWQLAAGDAHPKLKANIVSQSAFQLKQWEPTD
jgi:type I restriction enzyme M protein